MLPKKEVPKMPPGRATGFDEKKSPRSPGLADPAGYDSEDEDTPPDEYHTLRRRLDRGFMADPVQRRQERAKAGGWARPFRGILDPATLITDPEHVYRQPDGHCVANCAIFLSMRRRGFTPAQIIQHLRKPGPLLAARERWQRSHDDLIEMTDGALAAALALPMTDVENHFHRTLPKTPFGPGKGMDRSALCPIISTELIGQYPNRNHFTEIFSYAFSLQLENGGNAVSFTPTWPEVERPRSFQQQLFSRYRGTVPERVQLSGLRVNHDAPVAREAWRTPEPFIVFDLFWSIRREDHGHAFLLDLSDPQEPGIFDPNFGWFGFPARAAYLPIEFVLHVLWETYVRPDRPGYFQGGPMPRTNRRKEAFIFAFQTYAQELIPPAEKDKKASSWRSRFLRR